MLLKGIQSKQPNPRHTLAFAGFPHGLNTYRPASRINKTELSTLINCDLEKEGRIVTRHPIIAHTTTATTNNSAIKTIAHVYIGSTAYTLIQDAAHKIYYLDSDPKPVYVAALTAHAEIISFNGVALLMDGSYLKYMDDVAGINLCYDDGDGSTAYQYNNTCGDDDTSTSMYSGSVVRVGSKITTLAWDAGYTIPLTTIEVWLSKTGAPTGNISAKIYDSTGANLLQTATTTVDSSTLTTNATKQTFSFGNAYNMALSTAYIFSIEYSGGDASNKVNVHASTVGSGGKQYQYDGSWSNVSTKDPMIGVKPGRPPKASFGAVADLNLFLAGDPDNPGYMWVGNKTYLDFSTEDGGGYVGAVDDSRNNFPIGGIAAIYNDIYVYGKEAQPYLCKLTGSNVGDYSLPMTFQRAWTTSKTLVNSANDLWIGSGDGVDALSGVQEYGDVRTFSASDPVKDRIDDYWDSDTAFAEYRASKGQYMLVEPAYHRVLIFHTKLPIPDPGQQGTRYPVSEHEYYRDVFTRSAYYWFESGSGTNEYYLTIESDLLTDGSGNYILDQNGDPILDGDGDPSIPTQPDFLTLDGALITEGTAGSLADHEWDFGDNDSLGYNTIYFRDDSGSPNSSGVDLRSILIPTAMCQTSSGFLIGGSDGFVYTFDTSQHLEQSTHQIKPRIGGVEAEIPFGEGNVTDVHLLATSSGGGTVNVYLYKNNGTSETISKSINIDQSSGPLYKQVNFNARSVQWALKNITINSDPIQFEGLLLKYRSLT